MAKEIVAIPGGRGMLGTDLAGVCRQADFDVKVIDLPEFDITNSGQLKAVLSDVDVVVNCAAYTDVEKAEAEYEHCYKINAAAVGELGNFARQADKWVLHISTDFVFDGRLDRPYVETDRPNPINAYGQTKLEGERLLEQSGCRNCIIRTEWTYGAAGDNFVTKLVKRAKTEKKLKVVDDQIGSPTATMQVAKTICRLLREKPEGLFHFASAGYVSRFEMAEFIFDKLGFSVDLARCKAGDYASAATRPLNSRFDCSKIETLLGSRIESWQGPLERFLEKL